jgi:hypothetical protein
LTGGEQHEPALTSHSCVTENALKRLEEKAGKAWVLGLATVTETAATTARESQDNEPISTGRKMHETGEERRTDFNDEKESHEEEACVRKKGPLASDCGSKS